MGAQPPVAQSGGTMGFLGATSSSRARGGKVVIPTEMLTRMSCAVCPLNTCKELQHPKMPAHGTRAPLVYMLGEAPGADEDARGRPFVGKAGRTLRMRIPSEWAPRIRMNNVIQCRPPGNRDPTAVEVAACRGRIVSDIEATKPKAIFGFGNVPLQWVLSQTGITKWSGRRIPVQIGKHKCWFFPMLHPSYVNRTRKYTPNDGDYGSEIEFAFALDLKRAFAEVEAGLPPPVIHTSEQARDNVFCITGERGKRDRDDVVEFLRSMRHESVVGLDYETNCYRPYQKDAKILTIALSGQNATMAWAVDHREAKWSPEHYEQIWDEYEKFLYEAPGVRKVVHHLGFEQEWTASFFGHKSLRAGSWGCSVVQAYTLDERMKMGKPDCLSLEFLCFQYFGLNVKELSDLDRAKLDFTPLPQVLLYNGIDARYHRHLFGVQDERLIAEKLHDVYQRLCARVPTLVLTQLKGVPIDQTEVDKFYVMYTKEIKQTELKIEEQDAVKRYRQLFNKRFKVSSNQDIMKLFQRVLRKDIDSTDEVELKKLKHPLANLIVKWRKANKNLSTYVLPLRTGSKSVWPDGKLHALYSPGTRTRTSRTSCEDPNEQNYPKRVNKKVRSQIKPKREWCVVSFDYGQIQARNVAMESKDPALIKAFWDRYDIHTDWMLRTQKLYPQWIKGNAHLKDKTVAKAFRDKSKNRFVFPSFFGAQPRSIAEHLGIPEYTATKLHHQFWQKFPNIKDWHERIKRNYRRYGYVTGLSGVRRHAPISPNELINAPIQADEAMIVVDAMERLSRTGKLDLQANMEIHDDLTFMWRINEVEKWAPIVIDNMVHTPFKWAHIVPLVVEMSVGTDWSNQKEVGVYASDTWNGDLGTEFFTVMKDLAQYVEIGA